MKQHGFTLAELLIALAILGIIATFAIPKVLQNQQDSKRKAIFQETYATLSSVIYQGVQAGEMRGNFGTYIMDNINVVKRCNTDATTQGCWTAGQGAHGVEGGEPGFTLHNGANATGFDNGVDLGGGQWATGFVVDYNGPDAPNTLGNDQIYWVACFGDVACPAAWLIDPAFKNTPGSIGPYGGDPQSIALHSEIFKTD